MEGLAPDGVNTTGTLVSGLDPATGIADIEIDPLEFNWSTANRLTYFVDNAEKVALKFSTKNGLMSGTYRDVDGTFLLIRGAIFQKQNRVGGHFYSKKKDAFGYFYLLPYEN